MIAPVPGDHLGSGQRAIAFLRSSEGACQFSLQPVECFRLGPFLVAPDQVADVFADVLVGPVLPNFDATNSLSAPLMRTVIVVVWDIATSGFLSSR
jgi:hypothetical protein